MSVLNQSKLNNNMSNSSSVEVYNQKIICINDASTDECAGRYFSEVKKMSCAEAIACISSLENNNVPDAIIYSTDYADKIFFENVISIAINIKNKGFNIPFIIVNDNVDKEFKKSVLRCGADDCFPKSYNPERMNYWIDFLRLFKKLASSDEKEKENKEDYKISIEKRIFDIAVSGTLLLFLSPIMLVIAIIVKLESKGPVFYISKRTGVGYKVFNFLKFRSMGAGADRELSKLSHLNQYSDNSSNNETGKVNPVFFKIKNDPRITRFGKFLRDTSLDELPQLINVLKGDMSIVGNRPLPLYEAQQLTTDQAALRFMTAAGITGLWQVTKKKKKKKKKKHLR